MNSMKKILTTLLLPFFLASCTFGRLTTEAPHPTEDEAYFVMGIHPVSDVWLSIYDGTMINGAFRIATVVYVGGPTNGYIIGKADPIGHQAVSNVFMDHKKPTQKVASACNGARSMVFRAPAGKVTYVGDLVLKNVGGRIGLSSTFNAEAARRHVDQYFPALKGRMEVGSHSMERIDDSCTKISYTR